MKKQQKRFLLIGLMAFLALAFFSALHLSIYDEGVDVYAASGKASDIQAAVNSVVSQGGRGIVHVPAGTYNFYEVGETWQEVIVPAGVSVYGAPNNRDSNGQNTEWNTVLVMPFALAGQWEGTPIKYWFIFSGSGASNMPSRICDLHFQGYRTFSHSDTLNDISKGIMMSSVVDFRVDHCYFENVPASAVGTSGYTCCGVIDHNKFINNYAYVTSIWTSCTVGYGVEMHRAGSGYTEAQMFEETSQVIGHYRPYSIFIEDNIFGRWRHCVCANDGSHYVVRYNKFEGTSAFQDIDSHGVYTNFGTRGAEVYGNQFLSTASDPTSNTIDANRGGFLIWFNNYVASGTAWGYIMLVQENSITQNGVWKTTDCFFWNQPSGSKSLTITTPDGVVTPNVDYFVSWSSPGPLPSWEIAGYMPYQYPHPLVTGETYVSPSPSPTSSVSPTSSPSPSMSPAPTPSATEGTLTGTVSSSVDGSKLSGVTIKVSSSSVQTSVLTGSDGVYAVNLEAGIYALRFVNAGVSLANVSGVVVAVGEYTTIDKLLAITGEEVTSKPSPPEPSGLWFVDVWESLAYWVRSVFNYWD